MKGLLLKDFYVLSKYARSVFLILLFYVLIAAFNESVTFLISILVLFINLLSLNTFYYDEAAKWEHYALCLPVSRKQVVLSKYLLSLFLMLGVTAAAILCIGVFDGLLQRGDVIKDMQYLLATVGITLCLLSFGIPIYYKFGPEKGRILLMALVFVPVALFYAISRLLPDNLLLQMVQYPEQFVVIPFLPVIGIVCFAVSFGVSLGIYKRKEF